MVPTGVFLLLLFILSGKYSVAQEIIQGIIFDKETNQRISRVFIYNTENDEGGYNNTKGEFKIHASKGDILIAASEGYFPDTLRIDDRKTVVIHLQRSSIRIPEVSIIVRKNPDDVRKQKEDEYGTAYSKGDRGPLFTVGPSGAGLSIDALYRLISREGKNARRLQKILEQDYRENVIDYRFNPELVRRTTGLEGEQLQDFMQQYRPTYYFVLGASEYDLVTFVQRAFLKYKRNPQARRLPKLNK